jgi:creatinine deaminase
MRGRHRLWLLFKIPRVIVGEVKTFSGNLDFLESQGVEVLLVNDARCINLMTRFQDENRELWLEDIGAG